MHILKSLIIVEMGNEILTYDEKGCMGQNVGNYRVTVYTVPERPSGVILLPE